MNVKKLGSFSIIIFCLSLILAACGTNDDNNSSASNSSNNEANQEKTEENAEQDAANQEEENNDNENNEEEQKEEKEPAYEANENWYLKPLDDQDEEVVLITIDDAPDDHAVEMAHTLDDLDVPAIFFVNGHFIDDEEGEENLKEIDELGFPIGNHTMTHPDLTTISEEEQEEEILGVSEMVEDILGEKPDYFRAPHGKNTDFSSNLVEDEGMLNLNWSYGYDWEEEYQDADKLQEIMTTSPLLDNGAILLMHDRDWTNEALEDIVKDLQDQGYDMANPEEIKNPNAKDDE